MQSDVLEANHRDKEAIQHPTTSRSLGAYYSYDGACRLHGGDSGMNGNPGQKDYTLHRGKDYHWCREKCSAYEEYPCMDFEYKKKTSSSGEHCELCWVYPTEYDSSSAGHMCYVQMKMDTGDYDTVWDGACRKQHGDSGRNNKDYTRFTEKDEEVDSSLDLFDWCKRECSRENCCEAFEYRDSTSSSSSHCELWWALSTDYAKNQKNYVCYKKKMSVSFCPVHYYYDKKNGACRYKGSSGSNGKEYDYYEDETYDWCQMMCSKHPGYEAFEYKHKHCKLWWVKPTEYHPTTENLECYIKDSPI